MERNKIKIWLAVIVLAFVGLLTAGTIAEFYTEVILRNKFSAEPYRAEFFEEFESPENWLPGMKSPSKVYVTNTGGGEIIVRVKYEEQWVSADGKILPNILEYRDGKFVDENGEDYSDHVDMNLVPSPVPEGYKLEVSSKIFSDVVCTEGDPNSLTNKTFNQGSDDQIEVELESAESEGADIDNIVEDNIVEDVVDPDKSESTGNTDNSDSDKKENSGDADSDEEENTDDPDSDPDDTEQENIVTADTLWMYDESNSEKYYYYLEVLKSGESTQNFLEEIQFNPLMNAHLIGVDNNGEANQSLYSDGKYLGFADGNKYTFKYIADNSGYVNAEYKLSITMECLSADKGAMESIWHYNKSFPASCALSILYNKLPE